MKDFIENILKEALGSEYIPGTVEVQAKEDFGHYTTPIAMRLAKEAEMQPRVVAENVKDRIDGAAPAGFFEKVEVAGSGFVNFWIADDAARAEFGKVVAAGKEYGRGDAGKGKKVIVEYSQPNIAKELHTGHLRNTILGDALANVHDAQGYKVIRWNYMGDWGTQFGKMIAAWKHWGSKDGLGDKPIEKLQELYVRFNAEAKDDAEMEKEGAAEFRKLEQGDKENRKLWEWFKEESLREIQIVYGLLGVKFDTYISESFFEDRMELTVKELLDKKIAVVSEGAVIVPLDAENLPPGLIRKSDGASLYLTRDIAALEYRLREYKPAKLLYVVGNEQSLHFSQLLAIAAKLGFLGGAQVVHVKYGLLLTEAGKKMSSRAGTSVSVKGLIEKAIELAREVVEKKNSDLSDAEKNHVAHAVGVGALKYFMLHEGRTSDIVFDWKKMLDFTGDSGPYLQYTYARLRRVIVKAKEAGAEMVSTHDGTSGLVELTTAHELRLMRKMFQFPDQVARSAEELITNNLTEYLYQLAGLASRFYEAEPIITDGNHARRSARLLLADTAARTIASGLKLLGIEAPETI